MNIIERESLYYVFLEILRLHYYRTHTLLDEIGVYPGQPPMLFVLNNKQGLTQKEIAALLKLKPSTITVMLKRMEKADLIMRKQDDKDQRILRVYLTEKGEILCTEAKKVMDNINEECFGNFHDQARIVLKENLNQIRDNLIKSIEK